VRATDRFVTLDNVELENFQPKRNTRRSRTQPLSIVKAGEYLSIATNPSAEADGLYAKFSEHAQDYHIAEIKSTRNDGARYIYGLPVYNIVQKEVTFNASNLPVNCENGQVTYTPNDQNSSRNNQGVDGFFSRTTLPPYAHSYLLTNVLSADFVDLEPVGPGDEDLGSYVNFDYTQINNYGWRMPYETNTANFDEGLYTVKGSYGDEKGSYLYGRKDVYFLAKITTKNYVAIFNTSSRSDGYGVAGENGGKDSEPLRRMKKLDSIALYAKGAYELNPNCEPIKVVHFEYEENSLKQLCQGIPNADNNGGKLTLKRVYFTYGGSEKGRLSPYEFYYDMNNNPNYSHSSYDRWGNYKERPSGNVCGLNDNPTNQEYPYVDQDNEDTDLWSAAWSMTKIKLPSGGTIEVSYESDDYAYVQDKLATQMFKISGIGYVDGSDDIDVICNQQEGLRIDDPAKIFIELKNPVTVPDGVEPEDYFYERYLQGLDWIYFRTMARVNKSSQNGGYEYVSGYAKLRQSLVDSPKAYGLCNPNSSGEYQNGWFELEMVEDLHPISLAAVQFARIYTPQKAYGYEVNENSDIGDFIKALSAGPFVSSALEAFQGSNKYLFNTQGLGKDIKLNKSWVKLVSPDRSKKGGGSRVSQLSLSDNWAKMESGGETHPSYSQKYEYTKVLQNGEVISSGVAAYEPVIGNDENPLKNPVPNGNKKAPLAPEERFYKEKPYGESFFPAPQVGYSMVKVTSITPEDVIRHATGYVEHEFYTAKDYPVRTEQTDANPLPKKSGFLSQLFSQNVKDFMTASQGYVVELNDMHGKPKATRVFAQGKENAISGVEYYYKDNGRILETGQRLRGDRLVNETTVIKADGMVDNGALVGLDYDFVNDFRQQETVAINTGAQGNMYFFMVWIIPVYFPAIWPTVNRQHTRFRSAATTKVISRYGLLDEVVAWDQNSVITSKVIALDAATGEAVVNQTINEFEDEEYTLNYPAHWIYKGMGPSYTKEDLIFSGISVTNSQMSLSPELQDLIVTGDKMLMLEFGGNNTHEFVWVTKETINGSTFWRIENKNGDAIPDGLYFFRMVRPGERNQLTASAGSITTRRNPINSAKIETIDENFGVLSASANEYSDSWRTFCDCTLGYGDEGQNNPFLRGLAGQWRPLRSYYYLTDRVNQPSTVESLRTEGVYERFSPMWNAPANASHPWEQTIGDNWKYTSEVANYSPYGQPIEEVNIANIYSSALYGYNHSLPVAVAANAQRREIVFDGFEDYNLNKCADGHFNFYQFNNHKTTTKAHSGRYAIRLAPEDMISVTRNLNGCNK